MKCAKCGNEVSANAPCCPFCDAGAEPAEPGRSVQDGARFSGGNNRACCPVCGSGDISAVRRHYDPGCGCLGLLLLGWWGLLLGLLGAGDIDLVCRNCGTTWAAGRSGGRSRFGCLFFVILILLLLLFFRLI